jgi:hypothetical protein
LIAHREDLAHREVSLASVRFYALLKVLQSARNGHLPALKFLSLECESNLPAPQVSASVKAELLRQFLVAQVVLSLLVHESVYYYLNCSMFAEFDLKMSLLPA